MLELKSDLKPRQMISLNDRTRLIVYLAHYPKFKLIKVSNNIDLNEAQYIRTVIKAFQRRFRQDQIDGKIDQECLIISKNLTKILK